MGAGFPRPDGIAMAVLHTLRLVGRGAELQRLTRAVRSFAEGHGDAPALVTVGGDPGVGKSRIISELRSHLEDADLRWFTTSCAPYGLRLPWHPVRDAISALAQFEPGLTAEERLLCLGSLREDEGLEGETVDAARYLLSLPTESPEWPDLPVPERRRRLSDAVRSLVIALGRERLAVLVLEDLHWVDPDTLQWLDWALKQGFAQVGSRRPRVLVIAVHRMDFTHLWPSQVPRVDLRLGPLGARDSGTLLREIFGLGEGVPPRLVERLVEHTGGNPFFMEEAVRLLRDRGDLAEDADGSLSLTREDADIALPEGPRGLVEERVHRLERNVRHLLQCAAVIGPEVRPEILAQMSEAMEGLDAPLNSLVEEELLERREALRGLVLLFRHAITREVTYATILRRQRQSLHGRVGLHLEELHRDHLDEAAELLAHHFGASDLPDKAVFYLRLAAEQAKALCAHEAADQHLARLDEILEAHAHALDDVAAQRAWVALERGRLARLRGDHAKACDLLRHAAETMEEAPRSTEWRESHVRLLRAWGEAERQRGNVAQAVEIQVRALDASRDFGNETPIDVAETEQVLCLMGLGVAQRVSGDLSAALERFAEAERRARRLGDLRALAGALNNRAICLLNLGQARRALEPVDRAVALRRELGDPRNLVASLNNLGIVLERLLELDRALVVYAEALRLAYEIGHTRAVLANHINAGQLLQWLDNQPEAMRHFRNVLEHCGESPDAVAQGLALINLGWSHVHLRDLDAVPPLLEMAEGLAHDTADHSLTVHTALLRARWALDSGDGPAARGAAIAAVERLEGGGDELAMALRLLALAEAATDGGRAAEDSLRRASREARRNEDRREQIQILLANAGLAHRANRAAAKRRFLRRAERALARHPVPLLKRMLEEVER